MESILAASDAQVHTAYWQIWTTVGPIVPQILRRRGLRGLDLEDATQSVALKLLGAFRRMHAQERDALARGQPPPNKWWGLIAEMTNNVATDHHRAEKKRPPAESLEARSEQARLCVSWDETESHGLSDADQLADPRGIDPGQLAPGNELARLVRDAIFTLPPEERSAAIALLSDQPDSYAARRQRISESTAARRRRRALDTLQAPLRSAGYHPRGESAALEDTN